MAVVLLLLSAFGRPVGATCYHPNGQVVSEVDYVPCNNSVLGPAAPSMCCGLNRDGSSIAQTADTCMSNGLCQFQYTEADTKKVITQYWRDGCSSANWTACMPAGACDFVNNVGMAAHRLGLGEPAHACPRRETRR